METAANGVQGGTNEEGETLKLYVSSVSSNREMKRQQAHIISILETKKIPFEKVDISLATEYKDEMRALCADEKALPPRLVRGKKYLGDFEAFDDAVEEERLDSFLQMS